MNKLCIKFDIAYNAYEIIILFNEMKLQTAEMSMLKAVTGGIAKLPYFYILQQLNLSISKCNLIKSGI